METGELQLQPANPTGNLHRHLTGNHPIILHPDPVPMVEVVAPWVVVVVVVAVQWVAVAEEDVNYLYD
jgi:hypothetical protein